MTRVVVYLPARPAPVKPALPVVDLLRTRTEANRHVYRDYADNTGRLWTADATTGSGLRPEPETRAEAALAFAGGAQ